MSIWPKFDVIDHKFASFSKRNHQAWCILFKVMSRFIIFLEYRYPVHIRHAVQYSRPFDKNCHLSFFNRYTQTSTNLYSI